MVQHKIDTGVKYNTEEIKDLGVERSKVEVEVPNYEGIKPNKIEIIATKLEATNGQKENEVEFSSANYNWDKENGKITINTDNPNKTAQTGEDEYYITYYYGQEAYQKYQEFLEKSNEETSGEGSNEGTSGEGSNEGTSGEGSNEGTSGEESNEGTSGEGNNEGTSGEGSKNEVESTTEGEPVENQPENMPLIEFKTRVSCTFTLKNGEEEIEAKGEETNKAILNSQIRNLINIAEELEEKSISKGKIYANEINKEELYKIEINSKTKLNISPIGAIKEIQINNSQTAYEGEYRAELGIYVEYEDVLNQTIETRFNKENLNKILGETYEINIYNGENKIKTITEQTEDNEQGNIEIKYEKPVENLKITTTSPKNSGILYIENKRELLPNNEIYRDQIQKFEALLLTTNTEMKMADDTIIESYADTEIRLEETTTNLIASISESNLNAIMPNENIKLKLELDNSREQTDLWKNGIILAEMPKEIESLEIVDTQALYQDSIEKIDAKVIEYNGKKAIQIKVEGEQKHYITESVDRGTTIILTLNMSLKELTPNQENNEIKIYYCHENRRTYETEEIEKIKIEGKEYECNKTKININYTSPQIVYNIQKITGYDGEKTITSTSEKTNLGTIEIRAEEKDIKVQNIVLNNTGNEITNIKVLGKMPSKEATDLITGENLGTTINCLLAKQMEKQEKISHIYYTTNPNPSTDINIAENMWSEEIEDINQIKAYLIIIDKLETGEKLEYEYTLKIPADLEHCEYMYISNGVNYTQNTELGTVEGKAIPSKIGLTTGEGAILEITEEVSVGDGTTVNEEQQLRYEVKIKNKGKLDAKNVIAISNIPKWSSLIQENIAEGSTSKYTQYNYYSSTNRVVWNIGELKAGEETNLEFYLEVNKIPSIIEYYSDNPNFIKENDKYYINQKNEETGEIEKQEITEIPKITIESNTTVSCDNMSKSLTSNTVKNPVTKAYFKIKEETSIDKNTYINEGEKIIYTITIVNNIDLERNNIKISKILPEGVSYKTSIIFGRNEKLSYNETTREITTTLESLKAGEMVVLKIEVEANKLKKDEYQKEIKTNTKVTEGDKTVTSSEAINYIGKPKIIAEVKYDVEEKHIYEGDYINIKITVKNEEKQTAGNLKISQTLTNEFKFINGTMEIGNIKTNIPYDGQGEIHTSTNLKQGESITLNIKLKAKDLPRGTNEKEVTLISKIEGNNVEAKEISTKTYNIEKTSQHKKEEAEENGDIEVDEEGNITYKIQGQAWQDQNRDGEKTNDEPKLKNITVYLLKEGKLISQTQTNENGTYEFKGLSKGKYLVAFDYNQEEYEPTIYQKEGIITDNNSDVIISSININGISAEKAVTNEINIETRNIYNIDLGLVTIQKFDLKIEAQVSKIVLSTNEGTKTYEYNNVELPKLDIKAKEINGATAIIEYKIKISNIGDIAGTASQIISYNNKGLSFNSEFNPNWYQASDGNYYTNELQSTIINAGESKEISLKLVRNLNGSKTGIVENKIGISKTYNDKKQEDKDVSNNETTAKCLLTIATGIEQTYVITITLLISGIIIVGVYIVTKKILGKEESKYIK